MKKYSVDIASVQTWIYSYEVEAESEEEAEQKALQDHKQGKQSSDNWVDHEEFYQINDIEEVK